MIPMRLRRDYVAWCLSFADHLLSPSSYLMRRYRDAQLVGGSTEHLSNGILEQDRSLPPKPFPKPVRFACFSYLGEHKGIPTLLHAAESLAQDLRLQGSWHLTLAGHGHLAASIKDALSADRFAGAVEFVGRLSHDEAQQLQAVTHVIVLASEWPENEPVTLLEAVQSGTAQIASRLGGNCDLVEDGRSGFLFEPGNAKDLAKVMRQFIETPELAVEFGAYNAGRRESFRQSRTIDRLREIYDSAGHGSGREDTVVLCVGAQRSPEYARRLNLLLSRFFSVEDRPGVIRFIWSDWADSHVWAFVKLVWFWGDVDERNLSLVRQAVRNGVPCLMPFDAKATVLTGSGARILQYDTLLEALGFVAALQDVPSLDDDDRERETNRTIATVSPGASFALALREESRSA